MTLLSEGILVFPIPEIQQRLPELRNEFIETCNCFPEFVNDSKKIYVLGGFSALANPSSFHNVFVRKIRQWCHVAILPHMKILSNGHKLEQIIDRMMYRPAGITPSKETWHWDEAPQACENDMTFGGWVNFDTQSQWFSCAPGTHMTKGAPKGGFKKIKKEELVKKLEKYPKKKIEVKPGHFLVFFETILHEVLSEKKNYDSMRLFLGWRLTLNNNPLYSSNIQAAENFAVPRLKSGQLPPMYSQLHWTNWLNKLENFSQSKMKNICLENKFRIKTGTTHKIVMRFLPNLKELNLSCPPPYDKYELQMLVPRKKWTLLVPGSSQNKKTYNF